MSETQEELDNMFLKDRVQVTTPPCPVCHERSAIILSKDQYSLLVKAHSPHIQDIFPGWDADRRELLITGTHPECWDKMFDETDEEDEDIDDDDDEDLD